jgi:ribosome maturation factor RimP
MIRKENIEHLAAEYFKGTDRFVVRVSVGKDNKISVYIDGDTGVTIDHCVQLSRHIEQQLDRDAEDFELNVLSAGIGEPFLLLRQYHKNIGEAVEVMLEDGTKKRGILSEVGEDTITLKEAIKQKNKKSKKMVTGEPLSIDMKEIKYTKGIVVF